MIGQFGAGRSDHGYFFKKVGTGEDFRIIVSLLPFDCAASARTPSTYGPADIYVVRRNGDAWSAPIALSPLVNTAASESAVIVTPDGRQLLFVRDGKMYQIAIAALGLD